MSKGRRYNGESNSKLNFKKVVAVVIALLVTVMFVVAITKLINANDKKASGKDVSLAYYTIYENEKWGVINSKGETIISPTYDEILVIPNTEKAVFIVAYDVNYSNGTYKTKAINEKNKDLFTNYEKVEAIQNQDIQNSVWYSTSCLRVEKDGKYGLIDFSGKVLLDCQYEDISPILNLKNSLVTVKDGKKGLVSDTGAVIINNEYSSIEGLTDKYEDGYIVKNDSNKYGVIGTSKKIVVPVEFDEVKKATGNNSYVVKENGKLEIYDSSNESKKEIAVDNIKTIDSGNVIVKKGELFGLYTTGGEEKINPKYQDLTYIFSTYYIAKLNNKYGIISNDGSIKVDFLYKNLLYRKDANFIEGQKDGTVESDLLDRELTVKLTGIISEVNVNKGYMKVRTNNDYKYYNFKFEEKKNTELLLCNTLFLSKKDGKYGYVDKNGVVVVNYIYDDATEQNNSGYVAVKKDGKWGAIDAKGNVVVEPSLTLNNNSVVNFIGTYHLAEDANAGYYTK